MIVMWDSDTVLRCLNSQLLSGKPGRCFENTIEGQFSIWHHFLLVSRELHSTTAIGVLDTLSLVPLGLELL